MEKVKFDLEEFKKGYFVINCKTEKEDIDFLSYLYSKGIKWSSDTPLIKKTCWEEYREQTCYRYCFGLVYEEISLYLGSGLGVVSYSSLEF